MGRIGRKRGGGTEKREVFHRSSNIEERPANLTNLVIRKRPENRN